MRRLETLIDTVRLWAQARPTQEQFRWHWQKREVTPARKTPHTEYFFNPDKASGIPLRATYRPESRQGPDQFLIEVSLPRVVFGNNWTLIPDVETATQALDEMIEALSALPPLPPSIEMPLSRLDICYNYPVGALLPYYIEALSRLDYPHRTTVRFNAQTVEYRAKCVKSKFYDKHIESARLAPPGLLRHEITFQRAKEIKHALGADHPVTLSDLTNNELLRYFLERDLERLGIRGKTFATVNTAAGRLLAEFGPNRGGYRFTVLSLYQTHERSQVCELLNLDRNTLNRLLAEIRKTGISLALSEDSEPLPPLEVYL